MRRRTLAVSLAMSGMWAPVQAYDVTDKLSIGGVFAGAGQCQVLDGGDVPTFDDSQEAADQCRGAVPIQPEFSFHPNDANEVFFKLGFAAGNDLNPADVTPFALAPWAADLEDDVKDINGRGRDYLLTAWYKYTAKLQGDGAVGATFGIIDATDYLDDNKYASDEYTQFMNAALVNGPNVFLPSYDMGVALEWEKSHWSLRGVYMNVGENDDGNNFNFFGAQLGYRADTPLGEGNYRILVDGASKEFLDPSGTSKEPRSSLLLSFDQELGEVVGAWIRFGWQDDKAAIDFEHIYSGGINLAGSGWGRADDNIGLGYAYLGGGNQDLDEAQVAEGYYRFAVNEVLAVSADVQYQTNDYTTDRPSPRGWVLGLRAAAEF